jgi:hypothetical protein
MLQTSEANIEVKLRKQNSGKKLVAFVAMSFREEEEPGLVDYFKAMERAVRQQTYQ